MSRAIHLAGSIPQRVCLISIPDYAVTPFGKAMYKAEEISAAIDSFNDVNREIALLWGTTYLDVTETSRKAEKDPGLVAPDGLHYAAGEYALWADLLVERILAVAGSSRS